MDGVLVDTEQSWHDVRRRLSQQHGGAWHPGANRAMQGLSTSEWTSYMVRDLGIALERDEIARLVSAELDRIYHRDPPFLPGALDTVRRLASAGRHLALASSSPRTIIDTLLDSGGITDAFSVVVSSEEVPRGKPSPDVYLEAARRLGVEPGHCAAVEDSHGGIRSAKAAGMRVIAIPNPTYPPDADSLAQADVTLDTLADLTREKIATDASAS